MKFKSSINVFGDKTQFRTTIPKKLAEELGLKNKDVLEWELKGKKLMLSKKENTGLSSDILKSKSRTKNGTN